MVSEEKTKWAADALREKYDELGRLPQKSDFDPVTLSRIKAFLGPWPRALEAAGLKQTKSK
ncbi:MAG: homing endonuclease associated repeat-containing protein [Oscillospiraceae bacterium]